MRRAVVAVVVVLSAAQSARAQRVVPDSGSRIRVRRTESSDVSEGKLISLSADSLVYAPYFVSGRISIPMARVRSLEVSGGMQRSNRAVLIGTGLGALTGVGLTALLVVTSPSSDGQEAALGYIIISPILVAGGMVAGAVIGAHHRAERWSPVRLRDDAVGVLIGPGARGTFVIGVTIPFGGADSSALAGATSQ